MIEISVFAKDFYSRHSLAIEPGETYRITLKIVSTGGIGL